MSELDNPWPDLEDDAQDTALNKEEETDGNMATEIADHEKFKQELKLFLQLYTTVKNEITLGILK